MNKVLKTIGKICSNLLVALVVLATLALVAPRVAGWRPFTVLSGSMEPTYHVGSLILSLIHIWCAGVNRWR